MRFTYLIILSFSLQLIQVSSAYATPPDECSDKQSCTALCGQRLTNWTKPETKPIRFASSKCEKFGTATPTGENTTSTVGCACQMSSSASIVLAKDFSKGGCLRYSRAHTCLYKDSEFPGCDIQKPDTSCKAACADLQKRIQEDEQKTFSASVQDAHCARTCYCLTKIEGKCYLSPNGASTSDAHSAQDCTQSAEELVEARNKSTPSGCGCSAAPSGNPFHELWIWGLLFLAFAGRRKRSST